MVENAKVWGYSLIGLGIGLLIILSFIKTDIDTKDAALCKAYQDENLNMENCPAHTSHASWYLVAMFGITFLILGIGIYMLFLAPGHTESSRTYKQVDLAKLEAEERQIYDAIKAKEGSAYQADLIKETGFSKVKVTRMLDKLETYGIVERKRRGMTNIIVLK